MRKLFAIVFTLLFLSESVLASVVSSIDLIKALEKEFLDQGIANNVELEIFGGQTEFEINDAKDVKMLISDLQADDDNNKFTANAEIFADGVSIGKTDLLGRFFIMKEVYVPAKNIDKNDIIKSEDLMPVLVRENKIKEGDIIDADSIIGKQAVKLIKSDKIISDRDIRDEIVVLRGQEVMVVYKNKGLQITSKMEALEDGSKGSFIKFINTKSSKEVMAKVIDKNTAEIRAE